MIKILIILFSTLLNMDMILADHQGLSHDLAYDHIQLE